MQLNSQNLVVNPGFEDHGNDPASSGTLQSLNLPGWTDPTAGTSDIYFISNGEDTQYHPLADSGKSYAALWGSEDGKYWAEYVQGTFVHALRKNIVYRFSFALHICDGYGNENDINSLGVRFCDSLLHGAADVARGIPLAADVRISRENKIERSGRWTIYFANYKAKGGERHFILGSFNPKKFDFINDSQHSSYFFIDNVSLTGKDNLPPGPIPDVVFEKDTIAPDKFIPVRFKNSQVKNTPSLMNENRNFELPFSHENAVHNILHHFPAHLRKRANAIRIQVKRRGKLFHG
ncbi:MAG: hypothetical protein HY064_14530 [Bacteroidetes bacterium]|nr:hypothetical protein [Bacteroidota bacterium]